MAERDVETDILVDIYEEHGATLHRLIVLLGAESESGHIMRTALLSLGRRVNHVVDPLEQLEYLEEQVVHLARGAREPAGSLYLPEVADQRQDRLLRALAQLPPRVGEALVVSHYLAVFGPELARILRMTIHATNRRLEAGLDQLRHLVGNHDAAAGVIDSLSGELTAALRAAARLIQPAGTETLAAELRTLGDLTRHGVSGWVAALLFSLSLFLGGWLAMISSPAGGVPVSAPTASGSPTDSVATALTPEARASHSLPAQARSVPVFYVGRKSGLLHRELRDLPAGGDLVQSALDAVLTLAPLDPDYDTVWGPGTLIGTTMIGNQLTVNLSKEAFEGVDTSEEATMAALQMVYTASKLAGNPDLRLTFLEEGQAPPAVFAPPTGGFGRLGLAPVAPLWVTWPKNGATIGQGQAVIVGSVKPEAAAPVVTVKSEDGRIVTSVVAQTATSAGADGWRSWSVAVQFGPGEYLITASSEITDAAGRTRTFEDTKSITVP